MLGIDVKFLLQDPNEICQYFSSIEEMIVAQYAYSQTHGLISQHSKVFRLLALISFAHPVVAKQVEEFFVKHSFFSQITFESKFDLENLNILCLIPTFNF